LCCPQSVTHITAPSYISFFAMNSDSQFETRSIAAGLSL
jgi:hypothetical protein